MNWTFQTKDYRLEKELKTYIDEKLLKIEALLPDSSLGGEVKLTKTKHSNKDKVCVVQITVRHKDTFLRAEERAQTMQAAFDVAYEKLQRQFKRLREKQQKRIGHQRVTAQLNTLDESQQLMRNKKVRVKPLYVSDAIEQMELLDHDFYMFLNIDTQKVNVVYRRSDGGFGLLESEDKE